MADFVRFPSSIWTLMREDPERARAEVYSRYRTPVFRFVRNQGFSEHDAEDLTQEVFGRVCRGEFLGRADRERGRFRSLLLGVTRNVLLQERDRRGRGRSVSLDAGPDLPALEPDEAAFDAVWVENLVRLALERLRVETPAGGPRFYEALALTKLEGLSYADAAARMGVTVTDITNWVHQGKARLKRFLAEEIQAYAGSDGEMKDELRLYGDT